MMDFETGMERMKRALYEMDNAMSDVFDGYLNDNREYERMKNCVNCEHFEVCVVVHDRKRRQAGDYTACGKWKLVEK